MGAAARWGAAVVEDVNLGDDGEVVVAVRPRFSHDGTVLRSFTQAHPGGALALFDAEGWETYTVDPERTWRALSAPGVTTLTLEDLGLASGGSPPWPAATATVPRRSAKENAPWRT